MMLPPPPFSMIFLPTLRCDADCEYCFEKKGGPPIALDLLSELFEKVFSYMDGRNLHELQVYWQGGEVLTLSPGWIEKAYERIAATADCCGKHVAHFLQSNLLAYGPEWEPAIARVFGNEIGSSVDYPNRHRKAKGGHPEDFNPFWLKKADAARKAGNRLGVIAIPGEETLHAGAEKFYDYFTRFLRLDDFQLNNPFPGGTSNAVKQGFPLDPERLGLFYTKLVDIWMEKGYENGVRLGPFDQLLACFLDEPHILPCIWHRNCADQFICVGPDGTLAQCDCWTASYPEYHFGNIFENRPLDEILNTSSARKQFLDRPARIVENQDCIDCQYLAICHGGCPVRTYSMRGGLFEKDPYCPTYLTVFRHMENVAAKMAAKRRKIEEPR